MSEIVSTQNMLKRVEGLAGTNDLTDWEQGFVKSLSGRDPTGFSGKQIETLERIHDKHFA